MVIHPHRALASSCHRASVLKYAPCTLGRWTVSSHGGGCRHAGVRRYVGDDEFGDRGSPGTNRMVDQESGHGAEAWV
jgi:hypothetical protein